MRMVVRGVRGARILGRMLAAEPRGGDVLLFEGDVGAGKTETCRWYIRQATGVSRLVVPSPTYLLQQVYESEPPVHHFDLYRLPKGSDMRFLDMEESFARCVSLVEWPERLEADALPLERLDVKLTIMKSDGTGKCDDVRTMDAAQRHRRRQCLGGIDDDDTNAVMDGAIMLRKRMGEILSLEMRRCDGNMSDDDDDDDECMEDTDEDSDEAYEGDDAAAASTLLPETCTLPRLVELRPHGPRWATFTSALEVVFLESAMAAAEDVHSVTENVKDVRLGRTVAAGPSLRALPLELAER